MYKTPVLVIIFNRTDTVEALFEVLKKVQPKKLYIAGDGPRLNNEADVEKCKKARDLSLSSIDWECEVKQLFQPTNLGCSQGPITAIKWFFNNEEQGIILEDDGIPDPSFFPFCEELLEKYKSEPRIMNIVGGNFGYQQKKDDDSYLYARFSNTVGWATWRDRFEKVDFTLSDWNKTRFKRLKVIRMFFNLLNPFDLKYYKKWYYIFNKTIKSQNLTWWDYQFIYHQVNNKQLTIIPTKNLISNIGYNNQGTHTLSENSQLAELKLKTLDFPLKHPKIIKANYRFEEDYIKTLWI